MIAPTLAAGLVGISPPVLFFFLGALATLVRSNLRVPRAVTKLLSLYLLWAIGFTGGVKLQDSGLTQEVALSLGAAMALACAVPVYTYFLLRRKLGPDDAAAISACYGSVSAVTFVTAQQWLDHHAISYGGHMVAAMALMESPAIIIGVLLLRLGTRGAPAGADDPTPERGSKRVLLHEATLNGAVLLLLGSLLIGVLTGKKGYEAFKPLCTDLFSGVLVFFLLDLGIISARKLKNLRQGGAFLIGFAVLIPVINALCAIALAKALGLSEGNAILLAVLAGSASYIAVPAAAKIAIPKADPSLYIPMALAVTFPFNIALGIPLYALIVKAWW